MPAAVASAARKPTDVTISMHVVVPTHVRNEPDQQLTLSLFNTRTGELVARSNALCEICGEAELLGTAESHWREENGSVAEWQPGRPLISRHSTQIDEDD